VSAGVIIIAETCPYCRKGRSPLDFVRLTAMKICHSCYERHLKALEGLSSGQYLAGCSECDRSIEDIKAIQGGGDNGVRMVIHYENGIYRPMCVECDRTYVPKRADLYADTEFWKQRGL